MLFWFCLVPALVFYGAKANEVDSTEHGVSEGSRIPNCTCGKANKESGRIVGGEEARVNEFPLVAALITPYVSFCGGSIITLWHILTAAHCTIPMKKRRIAVALGEHDLDRKSETNATVIIYIKETIEHKDYGNIAHHNDIALAVLEEEIPIGKFIGRVCLPTKPYDLVGKAVKVIGWGRVSTDGKSSSVLLKVNLEGVKIEKCSEMYPIRTNPVRQLCTFKEGKDSCKGDSGGPVLYVDPETNCYTQVGIVSYGRKCAKNPGVNTLVYGYIDWITENIEKSHPGAKTCQ